MKKHRLRTFQYLIAGMVAFSALYLVSVRFTSFLSASRPERIVSLLAVLIISFPFTLIIFNTFVSRNPDALSKPKQISTLLITLLVAGGINFFLLPPIQFPETHLFEIETIPGSGSGELKILSIEELDIRSMMRSPISRDSLHLQDAWEIDPINGEISWHADSDAPLIYSRFMQEGLHIQFAAGPKGGKTQITWDGQEQIIDLVSPVEKTVVLTLAPAFNYRSASRTQKALVGAAYIAQWTLMASFFYWSIATLIAMPAERARTLILAGVILFTLFPLVSYLNPPVSFPDPGLEAAIRDAVDQPWGRLRQQKLLTIARLDLANTGIYDLEGFQHLTNVSELSLSDNNIADISPLRDIISLHELNLRGNKIEDISPIANLTSLENLNLRDNPINDLSPLEYLRNLHTLNLHGIPIQNLEILANFPQLSRLNLRDCGITNLTVLAELMREGALQDDALHLVRAELDIRDNPIPRKDADGYAPLRPYWENIYDRAPFILPPQTGVSAPIFSHAAGFYEDAFTLTLTTPVQDAVIYYTLDGSKPGLDSAIYNQPIKISQPVATNEDISQISTTSPQWEAPAAPIFKGAVVRAVAIFRMAVRVRLALQLISSRPI